MSVIQQIQEKYAKLMAIIIAVALLTFVIMLAFENGGSLFRGSNSNVVGSVNGKEIDNIAFSSKLEQYEENLKNQGYGDMARPQALEQAWNLEVRQLLMSSELEKLGMKIGKKELGDILYGPNAANELKQQFTDPQTGVYNATLAKQQIDQMLRSGTAEEKARVNEFIGQLQFNRLNEKYGSLLTGSVNYPKWMIEKQNAENSQLSKISFVREFYTNIPDSAAAVSNKEIEDYVNKHKEEFKQEESRSVAYVSFSALPTASDSVATKEKLLALKPEFDSTADIKQFLEMQGIRTFYNGYINAGRIQVPLKDSIIRIPVNSTYGPYLDGGNYALARMLGTRTQPDSVNFRHILIGLSKTDPQSGQQYAVRDSATAYKLADSLRTAIAKGTNFDSLVVQFTDDEGSKATKGVYEKRVSGEMVAAFNDFIFGNPPGAKGIVNTEYGSHYIEILSQKGSSQAYKIAYLTQPIEASTETDINANSAATSFAASSRDQKSFDANVDKLKSKGIFKILEQNIPPTGYQFQQAGTSRELVRNIYEADLGEVLQPVRVGDNYVVAIVTAINKKGTMSVDNARPRVEGLLRNQKKAELIKKKIGAATTLEAVAAAWGGKIIESADSIRLSGSSTNNAISGEPKVLGASFNPASNGKISAPIDGANGVYVIRVEKISTTPLADANVAEQRKQKQQTAMMQQQQMAMGMNTALMDAAKIKDNRSKFY
jgi:peptidyl-prolyl cis-trans isomerase D